MTQITSEEVEKIMIKTTQPIENLMEIRAAMPYKGNYSLFEIKGKKEDVIETVMMIGFTVGVLLFIKWLLTS